MGLLERATIGNAPDAPHAGLFDKALRHLGKDSKKKIPDDRKDEPGIPGTAGRSDGVSERVRAILGSDYVFPFRFFDTLLESLPILKAALFFMDDETSAYVPWCLKNLDATTARRFRIPESFAERSFPSERTIYENQSLKILKPWFSSEEFAVLRKTVFFTVRDGYGINGLFFVAETKSSVPLDFDLLADLVAEGTKRINVSRECARSDRKLIRDPLELDRLRNRQTSHPDSESLFLVSSEAACDEILLASPTLDGFRAYADIAVSVQTMLGRLGSVVPVRPPEFAIYVSSPGRISPDTLVRQISVSLSETLGLKTTNAVTLEKILEIESVSPSQALKPYL